MNSGEFIYKIILFSRNHQIDEDFMETYSPINDTVIVHDAHAILGVDFYLFHLDIKKEINARFQVWDINYNLHHNYVFPLYLRGASAFIGLFDLNDVNSLLELFPMTNIINENYPERPLYLVGIRFFGENNEFGDYYQDRRYNNERYPIGPIDDYIIRAFIEMEQVDRYFEISLDMENLENLEHVDQEKAGRNIDEIFRELFAQLLVVDGYSDLLKMYNYIQPRILENEIFHRSAPGEVINLACNNLDNCNEDNDKDMDDNSTIINSDYEEASQSPERLESGRRLYNSPSEVSSNANSNDDYKWVWGIETITPLDRVIRDLDEIKVEIIDNAANIFATWNAVENYDIDSLSEEERQRYDYFISHFSKCIICGSENEESYLRRFFFSRNKRKQRLKAQLFHLIDLKEEYPEYFKSFKIGIPCCSCYKKFFSN